MKIVSFILAILFITVLGAVLAIDDPGYVLIARPPYAIEMPLTLFIPLLILSGVALYVLGLLLLRTWLMPNYFSRWRSNTKTKKARRALHQGLLHLTEGEWPKAEKALLTDLEHSDVAVLNYLGAAYASQEQGNNEKRDDYLLQAHESSPEHEFAIGLTQARLQHLSHQYEQELASLSELRSKQPRHSYLLKQLSEVYQDLQDWNNLANLLPELRKRKLFPENEIHAMELLAYRSQMLQSLPSPSLDALNKQWQKIPQGAQKHPQLVALYAQELLSHDAIETAEGLLRTSLNREWDETLATLYGQAVTNEPNKQLKQAKAWLEQHPHSAGLYLGLGRLANEAGQLETARTYLDKALDIRPMPEVYRELGRLLEKQGNLTQAVDFYRRGLASLTHERPNTDTGQRLANVAQA